MPQLCFLEWVGLPLGYSGAVTYIFSEGNVNFLSCGSVLCARPGNVHLCGVQQGGSTSLPSVYCSVTQQGTQGLTLLVSKCKWRLALVTILFLADTQVLTEALCQHTDLPNFGVFFPFLQYFLVTHT